MGRLRRSLGRAFAVDGPGSVQPDEAQQAVIDKICREVARRSLTTPALLFLEMSRPLNFLGAQALHFFQPIVSAVVDTRGYEQFAKFLEHRGSIDYLCRRIEFFEEAGIRCQKPAVSDSVEPHPDKKAAP